MIRPGRNNLPFFQNVLIFLIAKTMMTVYIVPHVFEGIREHSESVQIRRDDRVA